MRFLKRLLDVTVSASLLALLSPVLLLTAGLVAVALGRPIFFVQRRPGIGAKPFHLIKFRSMSTRTDACGNMLADHQRLGRVGRFLRAWSLDELPQLINVFRGEMSLVGPRPLLMHYVDLYSTEQRRRHDVRPGITGLAQVSGRNALSWEEKFALDVWYVDNWSFGLDLKILIKTAWALLSRRGVSHGGHASMPEFRGSRPDA